LPKNQSVEQPKLTEKMAEKVEEHYSKANNLYGERYYDDFLKQEFSDYLFDCQL
jgi:lysozyme